MTLAPWPDPVERVSAVLRDASVDARIEQLQEPAVSARAAAAALGCELAQIVKSVLLVVDGSFVLALVPGPTRTNLDVVADALGASEARVGQADEVVAATGFEPGGVAPFPHRAVAHVLLEPSLFTMPRVWVGAGTAYHMASLSPHDLQRLTAARPVERLADG